MRLDPVLLDLLACPACRGDLVFRPDAALAGADTSELPPCAHEGKALACRACGAAYEVRGGIPVLLPPGFERARIEKEKQLGGLMTDLPEEKKNPLFESEWKRSKEEFWGFVRGRLPAGAAVVSVGCGVDTAFLELGRRHTAVAFDLVPALLETLRDRHGSALNVAGAVQALPFRDGAFDAICCIDLIHHEPDRLDEIVRSFHRILRPGGLLFLEDVNAWGLLQMWKSVLLPRPLHGALRSAWHRLRQTRHRPAPYEFPTSVFRVRRLLAAAGFESVAAVELRSWPNTGRAALAACRALSRLPRVRRYHNFHYLLYAVKR